MIWRWFWREWRTPSLLIVWVALSLAVACVLALSSISLRISLGLSQQSREFIAADKVFQSPRPMIEPWIRDAQKMGLRVSRQLTFMTMLYSDHSDQPQLVEVKAVDEHYPLYGQLHTSPPIANVQPGGIWLAPSLRARMGVHAGELIDVGNTRLQVMGEIVSLPDLGFNPLQSTSQVVISWQDVEKTGAIQPGSRVTYRYLFAGRAELLDSFGAALQGLLKEDQRWFGVAENGGAIGKALQRAQQFLLLSALLTLILAVAAVVVAMGHYCRSRHQRIAVLKTLGGGQGVIRRLVLGQGILVMAMSALCGCLLGKTLELLLIHSLAAALPLPLPSAGIMPWIWALASLLVITLLVGIRPYRQLMLTPPLRVLRNEKMATVWPLRYYLPVMSAVVVGGTVLLVGNRPLLWIMLGAMLVLAMVLGGIAWGCLWGLQRLLIKQLALRLAINRLLRRPWVTFSQLSTFSLSFMLLALLIVLRGDLLQRWQQQLPADSPNYFLLNINQAQRPTLEKFLQQQQVSALQFYPIVRARLVEINHHPAAQGIKPDAAGMETLNRELNLTWMSELPEHNTLVQGAGAPKAGEVSIDQGVAERLGIRLGDVLTFTGNTENFTARVTSLRKVDWESLRANFFFIFSPGELDNQPQSWVASFRSSAQDSLLTPLNRQFPTVNILDINALLGQLSQVLLQVGAAVQMMVLLVMFCGVLLLLAQVQIGMHQRQQELVVYRTLGASRILLRNTLWCEFAFLGAVAGLAAVFGSQVALWLLQRQVFDFPWQPDFVLWWALPLSAAFSLACYGGWLGRRLLRGDQLLRQFQE
jgi:putative ABC transport system permease protein